MRQLILDYSKWRCGGDGDKKLGEGNTALLNKEGYMCCLGQFSLQLNKDLKEQDILGFGEPNEVGIDIDDLSFKSEELDDLGEQYTVSTCLSEEAININDKTATTPDKKIEKLKELFGNYGYEIIVTNKP